MRIYCSASAPRLSRSHLPARIYPMLSEPEHAERKQVCKVRTESSQKELTSDCRRAAAARHFEASRLSWQSMPGTGHQVWRSWELLRTCKNLL